MAEIRLGLFDGHLVVDAGAAPLLDTRSPVEPAASSGAARLTIQQGHAPDLASGIERRNGIVKAQVTAAAGMPSIEDDPDARQGKPGSDHAAVIATFDF